MVYIAWINGSTDGKLPSSPGQTHSFYSGSFNESFLSGRFETLGLIPHYSLGFLHAKEAARREIRSVSCIAQEWGADVLVDVGSLLGWGSQTYLAMRVKRELPEATRREILGALEKDGRRYNQE